MSLFSKIDAFVSQHSLIPENSIIILGLSGGPDSVLLFFYLLHLRDTGRIKQFIAAHLDHQWRPDSDHDVKFCQKLSLDHGVPFVTQKISELAMSAKFDGSQEAYGRAARRKFLQQVRSEHNAPLIALAHHLQDQEETFFIRLVRGTSLTGLTCMWPKSGNYIRPLLEINKSEIVDYLETNNISFLTDPSNESPAFLRNRIRATVLPALRACDERFDHNFLATLNRLQETELLLQDVTQQTTKEVVVQKNNTSTLIIDRFFSLNKALQYRILLQWLIEHDIPFTPSQAFLEEIMRFMRTPNSGKHMVHESWQLIKQKGELNLEYLS